MNRENAYQRLAPLYEELCDDCDYENWSQYFVMLLCGALHTEEKNIAGLRGLDIGCGSGVFTRAFLKKGCVMSGVDISPAMLSVAEEKTREEGLRARYFQGDVTGLKTLEKYDFALSSNDVINYVPKNKLVAAFKNVARALNKGGVYVFDISSQRKFLTKINGKVSADDRENVTYLSFGKVEDSVATLDVTLFVRRKDGAFDRFDELHTQYVYTREEIENALLSAGFGIVSVGGIFGENAEETDRLCFLAKKKR